MLTQKWEVIAWLLAGLVATKTAVIASLGRAFGLTNNESIRIGLILSQGGEFAFVILSLASQLKVLPENLNQVRVEAGGGGEGGMWNRRNAQPRTGVHPVERQRAEKPGRQETKVRKWVGTASQARRHLNRSYTPTTLAPVDCRC